MSVETRAKISASKKGKPGPWLGKKRGPHSDETRAKISSANRKPKSPQARAAIAAARLGKKHTEATKQKLRLNHLGKKHSAETRKKLCEIAVRGPAHRWWGHSSTSGPRSRWVRYNGIALRSSYELRLAQAFDARGIRWEYEPKRFDLGDCTYLPDFYLPDLGVYWEAKGWLDPKSKRKIELFRVFYPDLPLVVATAPVIEMTERSI